MDGNPASSAAVDGDVSPELLDALTSKRAELSRLELELEPRWDAETKALTTLENELEGLRARVNDVRAKVAHANQRHDVLVAELAQAESGLSRASRWWVRVLEPVLISAAVLASVLGAALTDRAKWPLLIVALVAGVALGRRAGARG